MFKKSSIYRVAIGSREMASIEMDSGDLHSLLGDTCIRLCSDAACKMEILRGLNNDGI